MPEIQAKRKRFAVLDLASLRLVSEPHRWLLPIMESNTLTPGAKIIAYVLIAKYANRATGDCYPSMEEIAAATNLKPEGVRFAMRKLRDAGYLTARRRGYSTSNQYLFALPRASETA